MKFKTIILFLGIGDRGLGIGDWAQSPIPINLSKFKNCLKLNFFIIINIYLFYIKNKYNKIKNFYLFLF